MARSSRASEGGYCYHVINRGNARAEVFHKAEDYAAFLRVVAEAGLRTPMRVIASGREDHAPQMGRLKRLGKYGRT